MYPPGDGLALGAGSASRGAADSRAAVTQNRRMSAVLNPSPLVLRMVLGGLPGAAGCGRSGSPAGAGGAGDRLRHR